MRSEIKNFIIFYLFLTAILPIVLLFAGFDNNFGFGFEPKKTFIFSEYELTNNSWLYFTGSFLSYVFYVLIFFGPLYLLSPKKIVKGTLRLKFSEYWIPATLILLYHLFTTHGFIANFLFVLFFVIICLMHGNVSRKQAFFVFFVFLVTSVVKYGINSRGSLLFVFTLGLVYFYKTEYKRKLIIIGTAFISFMFALSLRKYSMEFNFSNLSFAVELIVVRFNRIVFWMIPNDILATNLFIENNIVNFCFSNETSLKLGNYYNDLFSIYTGSKGLYLDSSMNSDYIYEIFQSSSVNIFIDFVLIYIMVGAFMRLTHIVDRKFIFFYLFYHFSTSESVLNISQKLFKDLILINAFFFIIQIIIFYRKTALPNNIKIMINNRK